MRKRTSASHACGSTPFILQVTMRLYMAAARWPPRSDPQNNRDFRPRATQRSPRSAALFGYGARDAAFPAGLHRLRRSWMGHRDRGVGSTKRRQAVMTMSCELELVLGRPYDLPGCAASADP